MAWIHQAMRRAAYNDGTFFDQMDVLVGCYYILAANTGRQVSVQIEDAATAYTDNAMQYTYQIAGENWRDFCRVEHGAQGEWGKIGTGKWDAAIGKYGPAPTPSADDAERAIAAIHAKMERNGTSPTAEEITMGCNRLLFGGAGDTKEWEMHDRVSEAAGSNWPDFCRVHSVKFKAIGTGKWDGAIARYRTD